MNKDFLLCGSVGYWRHTMTFWDVFFPCLAAIWAPAAVIALGKAALGD